MAPRRRVIFSSVVVLFLGFCLVGLVRANSPYIPPSIMFLSLGHSPLEATRRLVDQCETVTSDALTVGHKRFHGRSCGEFEGFDVDIRLEMNHVEVTTIDVEVVESEESLHEALLYLLQKQDWFGKKSAADYCPELDSTRIADVCIDRVGRGQDYVYSYEKRVPGGADPSEYQQRYKINIVVGNLSATYTPLTARSKPLLPREWTLGPRSSVTFGRDVWKILRDYHSSSGGDWYNEDNIFLLAKEGASIQLCTGSNSTHESDLNRFCTASAPYTYKKDEEGLETLEFDMRGSEERANLINDMLYRGFSSYLSLSTGSYLVEYQIQK